MNAPLSRVSSTLAALFCICQWLSESLRGRLGSGVLLICAEIREYCLTEYFNASCPGPSDVILMTSAVYGRMRLGRCIRGDYNLGCSNDVISLFDAQCSGRKSCDVSVRTLVDIRPCQRDFASYLEASYKCITGTISIGYHRIQSIQYLLYGMALVYLAADY